MCSAPRVAAVVVTYNRRVLLERCLCALVHQKGVTPDIWVIDNASTDGTGEMVQAWDEPHLHYHNTGENLGGAGGFAYGMRQAGSAGYDALWLMDDDTIPEPDALAELLQADKALAGRYGWLSCRALDDKGNDQPMNRQRKTMYTDVDDFSVDSVLVPAVMASFVSLFVRTEVVREYGLPIADFFIWSDDWEYTRRISRALPCYAVPKSRVLHAMQNPGTVNIATDVPARWPRYRYFYRNDVVLYRREGLAGWAWLLAKDAWHSAQLLRDKRGHRLERLGIIWRGFWQGVHYRPEIEYLP